MAVTPQIRRRLLFPCVVTLELFLALNAIAFCHAWRETHFSSSSDDTQSPRARSLMGRIAVLVGIEAVTRPATSVVLDASRTVHFMARDGVKLEAWDIPASTNEQGVAVMFHGYAASRCALLGEARVLHRLGWRTVLVDFRGSGGSDGTVTTLGWLEARDVAAATAWTRAKLPRERLILYGQSMGAVAILRAMATENVTADGVVLECPFDRMLTTVEHCCRIMGVPAFPMARLLVFWGGMQHGFNAFNHNPVVYARAVTCPALVLDGGRDQTVMPVEVRRVAAAMQGPAQYHIFRNAGHSGYLWDAAEEYRKTVGEWLTGLPVQSKNR